MMTAAWAVVGNERSNWRSEKEKPARGRRRKSTKSGGGNHVADGAVPCYSSHTMYIVLLEHEGQDTYRARW